MDNRKLKVAVCLSGQLRTGRYACHRIIDFFSAYSPDYFFHTWDHDDWTDVKTRDHSAVPINQDDLNYVIDAYKPKAYVVDARKEFELEISQSQQYSMMISNDLKRHQERITGEDYDVVIKCRFDLIWSPYQKFEVPVDFDYDGLYITHLDYTSNKKFPIVLDRFYFGSTAVMDVVSTVRQKTNYELKRRESLDHQGLYPEQILHSYCRLRGIQFHKHEFIEAIVRKDAAGLDPIHQYDRIRHLHDSYYK